MSAMHQPIRRHRPRKPTTRMMRTKRQAFRRLQQKQAYELPYDDESHEYAYNNEAIKEEAYR